MYIPPSFRIEEPARLSAFMNAYSFATLVSSDEGVPFASHLPMRHYVEQGVCTTLVSHMARANPQWQQFSQNSEVLTIFHGPHAYISPSWYETDQAVPTWNYATVHAYGVPTLLDDHEQVVALLADTVEFYEQSFEKPWPGVLPDAFRDQLMKSIVAFEIRVTRIEGKFKLGQNRSLQDVLGVQQTLIDSGRPNAVALAEFMQSEVSEP